MPARTNTEKLEAAEKEILRQGHLLKHLQERYSDEVGGLQTDVRESEAKLRDLTVKNAAEEQRLLHVEKLLEEGRTRRWQVWLAFSSAAVTAITAILIAIIKR